MDNEHTKAKRWFSLCLVSLLTLTLAVNLISAYIRLSEAGVGCEPWPDCYAVVGEDLARVPPSPVEAVAPVEAVKRAHRALATTLVVLVLVIVAQGRGQPLGRFARGLPYAIAFVVLLLAVVGPASYLKTLPAVASVNLLGGMVLLALTWLLWLEAVATSSTRAPELGGAARMALGVLSLQLLFGAWVSANYAAAACSGFLSCAPHGGGLSSFWYFRELSLDGSGRIVQDGAQALIQWVHHLWSIPTAACLGYLGARSIRCGHSAWGAALLYLLGLQLLLGGSGLFWPRGLWLVLLHNLVASLLLLAVLRLLMLSVPNPPGPRRAAA